MNPMKIYYVTFDTQSVSFRETKEYFFHCYAKNAKEAKELCKEEWPKLFNSHNPKIPHQFHIYAKQSRIQDVDLLGLRTWEDAPIRGKDCLGFICTNVYRWMKRS